MRFWFLIARFFTLDYKLPGMIRVFKVLMAIIAADMAGNQLVLAVNAESLGIGLERKSGAGILGRHRVPVGIEGNTELAGGSNL